MTTNQTDRPPAPATPAAVQRVVDTCDALAPWERTTLRYLHENLVWDTAINGAADRAHQAAVDSGRLTTPDTTPGSTWLALNRLCGAVGGAADVATAVLVHDLIDPDDYRLLTSWWLCAGMPPPGPDPIIDAWADTVGVADGPLPGTSLTNPTPLGPGRGMAYTLAGDHDPNQLARAQRTLATALGGHHTIHVTTTPTATRVRVTNAMDEPLTPEKEDGEREPDPDTDPNDTIRRIGEVRSELARVDAKAGNLLALAGTALGVGLAVLGRAHLPQPATIAAAVSALAIATAVWLLARALRPNLSGGYGYLRLTRRVPAPAPSGDGEHLVWLSRLARGKFVKVQHAVDLLCVALAGTVTAAALTAWL